MNAGINWDKIIAGEVAAALRAPGQLAELKVVIDQFLDYSEINVVWNESDQRWQVLRQGIKRGNELTYAGAVWSALLLARAMLENQIPNLRPPDDKP